VPCLARPELGVEVGGTTEAKNLLQNGGIARQKDQTFAIVPQDSRQRTGAAGAIEPGAILFPVYLSDSSAKCCPPTLIHCECHDFLTVRDQVGA
jgi:hypothetical protein